jgi:hypothetical protein
MKLISDIEAFLEEQLNTVGLGQQENIVNCTRCGQPCRLNPKPSSKARLIKRADTAKNGLCANCSATSFIKSIPTLMVGIDKNGVEMLLDERVQSSFEDVMKAGNSDAVAEELNWQIIVDNWGLQL